MIDARDVAPIMDIRAVNYFEVEVQVGGSGRAELVKVSKRRVEYRRAGDATWYTIPVVDDEQIYDNTVFKDQ